MTRCGPRRRPVRPAMVVLGLAILGAACGSGSQAANPTTTLGSRPATTAELEIASPAPMAVTGRDVRLVMRLQRAHLVPPIQVGGAIVPDQGHIHVLVDGQLVAMPYRLTESLPTLSVGEHTVEVEFVASDHLPFANRVVAAVTFTAR